MRLPWIAFTLLILLNGTAFAQTAGTTQIPLHEMMDLNYKTKQEIYDLRTTIARSFPQFIDAHYQPSDEVFGRIEDGKPWWGILGLSYYGPGQQSILGAARESRFITNPLLLVALDNHYAWVIHDDSLRPQPLYPEAVNLYWQNDLRQAAVTYDLTALWHKERHIGTEEAKHSFTLVAYNAKDLGWNFLYIEPQSSSNIAARDQLVTIHQFIHRGKSCGYPGGCNNMSPEQPALDITVNELPARAYIKLWRQQPADVHSPADMVFIIDMI